MTRTIALEEHMVTPQIETQGMLQPPQKIFSGNGIRTLSPVQG